MVGNTPVEIRLSRSRYARAAVFVLLALLVVLLGAAAKHSQYDRLPQPGYLSKAVKMAARLDPNLEGDFAHSVESPAEVTLTIVEALNYPSPTDPPLSAVFLLSPPLRV